MVINNHCTNILPSTNNVVALLTDFGSRSGYLSQIKATVLKLCRMPVQFVDITSSVTNFQIKEAAFILKLNYQYFPKGTIFIAIVDPDVRSKRDIIALKSEGMIFIAPDNGILSPVILNADRIVTIQNHGNTFAERDLYAEAASKLLCGNNIEQIGKNYTNKPKFLDLKPQFDKSSVIGEIMHIDDFGNIISNIQEESIKNKRRRVKWGNVSVAEWIQNYHNLKNSGVYIANIINSSGYLELASYRESAAKRTQVPIGDTVSMPLTDI